MDADPPSQSVAVANPVVDRAKLWLAAILVVYAVLRAPFILNELGGQDEQLFSVPGYTVAREGIPRIPYYPATNPDVFFYRSDEAVFALPPGLFYLQAPFFLVLPPGYPTSRWASFVAGGIAIWLVYKLGRRAAGPVAGLWGAGMYALSRVLFFAATFARPDEPCAAFGLGAIFLTWNFADSRRLRDAVAAGVLLGLGLLCHPFAIIFCLLCGVWTLSVAQPFPCRIGSAAILTGITLAVFALWVPLILAYRDAFDHQFYNNVLRPAGPGLSRRLAWPWPFVPHQLTLLTEQAGILQAAVMGSGLIGATVLAFRRSASRDLRRLISVAWGGLYLLTATQGHHPTKGYWCFTGALVLAAAGTFIGPLIARAGQRSRLMAAVLGVAVVALFLPAAGLRTWSRYVMPSSEGQYNGPEFARRMITELPKEGRFLVEPAFAFDVWLAGRDVTLRTDGNDYLVPRQTYDWLVESRDGLDKKVPEQLGGELVRTFGRKDDPFACYAELYRPQSGSPSSPVNSHP